jgi:hypothetical protein
MNEDDALMSRAADAIAESRRLATIRQSLLDEMAAIYQRRLQSAAKAAKGLRLSEEDLVGRYGKLALGMGPVTRGRRDGARSRWRDRPV